ncbi:MAG: family 43 glycosylhydrolase [Clostridia bacterium]|nr:family 43 glycosylhydrolase [Clostridia bacterium]
MKFITSIVTAFSIIFSFFSGMMPWKAVYYFDSVNGSDSNSGKSIEEPLQSLDKLNSIRLKSGNTVYIACGSEYRGQLFCQKGVTYAAYGEGEKPTFLGSADAADKTKWIETDVPNVWMFDEIFTVDVGNIIFNAGEAVGLKQITGIFGFKGSVEELKSDLSFWHNTNDNKVYLYSEQNPSERFNEIEFALCNPVISLAKGVTVDGIRVLYGGAHGIKGGKINVTVRNCEIGWTGGSIQPGLDHVVRYGNGIEFWADSNNVLVENCHIYQIYDAGITFQSNTDSKMKNITFRNNVIEKCTYSFEYFNGTGGLFKNILIDSNTFRDAGKGWGVQRRDPGYTAHINSWSNHEHKAKNFVISNNILDGSEYSMFIIESTAGTLPVMDSNTYIQYEDSMLTKEVKFSDCEEYLKALDPNAEIKTKSITHEVEPDNTKTFRNVIADRDAPDPFVTYDSDTGYYYLLFTCVNRLEIYRSRHAAKLLSDNDSVVVFSADGENGIYGDVWAPEMHKAPNGKWYIYTSGTAQQGSGEKRLFVMESKTENPFDGFIFKGLLDDDLYAIDPTVYTDRNGKQYICYSCCERKVGAGAQYLVIQELKNPWTLGKKSAVISKAEYDWELVAPYKGKNAINEGAFFVKSGTHLFIIYSGNGCWSDDYCLGILEYQGGEMCNKKSWKKSSEPLFVKGNGVYGPGHASFFYSPDGTELWCAYHGLKQTNPSVTYAPRYLNLQKVNSDVFGYLLKDSPTGYETDIPYPSGEIND